MTAALLDVARLLAGFSVGFTTARAVGLCQVCGPPTNGTVLGARHAPIVHPRRETHQ